MDRDTPLLLEGMDRMLSRWDIDAHQPRTFILDALDRMEALDWMIPTSRMRGPIVLGGRKRTVKGAPPPKPNDRRATVKAARKANRQRKQNRARTQEPKTC